MNTEKMKKVILYLFFVMILAFLCGCSNSSTNASQNANNNDSAQTITTASEAISKVKEYKNPFSGDLGNRIAGELGFNTYMDPVYGNCDAYQFSDGSWNVSIKGHMYGSTNEYGTDYEEREFEVEATIDSTGYVSVSVHKH